MDEDYEGKTSQVQITCNEEVCSKQKLKQNGHMTQSTCCIYDPQLAIDRKHIAYIQSRPIRFLVKLFYKDLKDDGVRQMVNQQLLSMLNRTEKSQLTVIIQDGSETEL